MPPPTLGFQNNHKLAHALSESLQDLGGPSNLALRPYNRFSTAFTTWWLVPAKDEWPAYHLSKLCLHPVPKASQDSPEILAGLQMEKGLTPKIADLPDVNPSHIIRPHWRVHSLPPPPFRDKILDSARLVLTRSQQPLFVMIDASACNRVPDPDAPAATPDDRALWLIKDQSLALVPEGSPTTGLAGSSDSSDLGSLIKEIFQHPSLDFFWLDLRLGVLVLLSGQDGVRGSWLVSDLWRSTLEPWLPILG